MEYLYYDSQHREIQAILDRLLAQVSHLDVSGARPDQPEMVDLRSAITEEARRLNNAVQEMLSTLGDLPSIPATAGPGNGGKVRAVQPQPTREGWASTRQLEAILNNLIAGVVVYDAEGVVKFANGYAIALFGFDPTRMRRDSVASRLEIYGEDGMRVLVRDMPSSIAAHGEVVMNRSLTLRGGLGRAAHVLCSAMPVMSGGKLDGVVAVWNDVTRQHNLMEENEQVRQEVERERDRLKAILTSMNDEVWYCDPGGNATLMNAVVISTLGVDSQEQLNGPLEEQALDKLEIYNIDGTTRPTEETPLLRALKGETLRGEEIIVNVRTGEKMYREYITSPVRSKEDEITGAVAVVRDISRQKQQEAELQETVAALRESVVNEAARLAELHAIMDAVPAIIFITHDQDAREVTGNRVAHEFLRVQPQGNLSKSAPEEEAPRNFRVFNNGRELRPEELPLQVSAATGRPVRDFEEEVLFDDGSQARLIGNAAPLLDENGQTAGAVAAFLDITERVEQNTQMEVQRRLMEHREMERQKIARDLHDGPVQALGGLGFSLQILQDISTEAAMKQMIAQMQTEVRDQTHELREVINELRPPALARFGLRRAIRSYAEDFQARHPGLALTLDLDESDVTLPDSAVLALYRIFQESLANITRHSQATRVTIRLEIEERRSIALEVEDNGVGFPGPIDWIELARNGHFGLIGMKERAEAAGGKLVIQSEVGKGTRLRANVPWEE